MLRIINALLLSMMLTFGIVFGVTVHNSSVAVANKNALTQEQISKQLQDYNRSLADDISISQRNKNANKNESTSPSHGGGAADEVPTGSFKELYTYAVNKLNRATYVYATSTARIHLIEGNAMGQVIKDEHLNFSTIQAKSQDERYFQFNITGGPIMGFNIGMANIHYTNGISAAIRMTEDNILRPSFEQYEQDFKWNMISPFHLPTPSVVNGLTDDEIISFIYNEARKEYVSQISIDVSNYNDSNFGAVLGGLTGASKHPDYLELRLTVIIGEDGTLKSITYNEHIDTSLVLEVAGNKVSVSANLKINNHTVNYQIIDTGFVNITKPNWA